MRSGRELEQAELVHPYLWPAAAVYARWLGFETLHAGAFLLPDRPGAWVVMAPGGGGKSSLLASLALAGYQVVVDDLVVVDGSDCFAGPRCIDLKPDTAVALGLDGTLISVRASERRRLSLSPCDGRMPIRGFVALSWGDEVALERQPPRASFALLAEHRRVTMLGVDYETLLELAGLPMLALRRPRSWSRLAETREHLVQTLADQ
jgi:hypothetical protein